MYIVCIECVLRHPHTELRDDVSCALLRDSVCVAAPASSAHLAEADDRLIRLGVAHRLERMDEGIILPIRDAAYSKP